MSGFDAHMETVPSLLQRLCERQIFLAVQGDRLRLSAPAGTVNEELREELTRRKGEILEWLVSTNAESSALQPLSFSQQWWWFLEQLREGSTTLVARTLRLDGELDVPALTRAVEGLVARHTALRTTFVTLDGTPYQRVHHPTAALAPFIDLTWCSAAEVEKEVVAAIERFGSQPFHLERGPLFRCQLVRLRPHEHLLTLAAHHTCCDGVSLSLIERDFLALYHSETTRVAPSLPEVSSTYADYARAERDRLTPDTVEAHLAYWREQLGGVLPTLGFPTDWPRPPVQTVRGASVELRFDDHLTGILRALSRKLHATLFQTTLAAFVLLIHRHTEKTDITIGVPVAGRDQAALEEVVGAFVRTLVIRADVSGSPTFVELLERLRRNVLDAFEHQDVPFQMLMQQIPHDHDLSHPAFFQAVFAVEATSPPSQTIESLHVSAYRMRAVQALVDLDLRIHDDGRSLVARWTYNADLFSSVTIERLARRYLALLEAIASAPSSSAALIPILPSDEQKEIAGFAEGPKPPGENARLHDLLRSQAANTPHAVAIEQGNETITYLELDRRTGHLAQRFQARGVSRSGTVAIFLDRSVAAIESFLAVSKAGGVYLPIDPALPMERVRFMLDDARPMLIVTERRFLPSIETAGIPTLCVDAPESSGEAALPPLTDDVDPGDAIYVIYTSGSTGRPKGVEIVHEGLVARTRAVAELHGLDARTRQLQLASPAFDYAGEEVYPVLATGGTVVVPQGSMLSPAEILAACNAALITKINLPTAAWHQLVDELWLAPELLPPTLEWVTIGGDSPSPQKAARWSQLKPAPPRLVQVYGPTEATILATAAMVPLSELTEAATARLPIGRPLPNTSIHLMDAQGQRVPVGVPGEIFIGGIGVGRGYLRRPGLTAESFVPDPDGDGARLYRTGDIARWRSEDGQLEFLGRRDQQVKVRGYRIELSEIEFAMRKHADIVEAVAILDRPTSPESLEDTRIIAYATHRRTSDETFFASELREFLQGLLPAYMLPSSITFLDKLPTTPMGKVDRQHLPRPVAVRSPNVSTPPSSDLEKALASIFADVLKLATVAANEDFFALGGHSLLATKVLSRIRVAFDVDVPLIELFSSPTVASLALVVERLLAGRQTEERTEDVVSQMHADATLELPAVPARSVPHPGRRAVLLTGATGFVGGYLLRELLERDIAVYCLVRGKNTEDAEARLVERLRHHGISFPGEAHLQGPLPDNVRVIAGDLSQPGLGLGQACLDELSRRLSAIYHAGYWVNFIYPYSALRRANVEGTRELLLALAARASEMHVHFVSSIAVFDSDAQDGKLVLENQVPRIHTGFRNGYTQTKCVAENLVLRARERGISASTYRLPGVGGDLQRGLLSETDFFWSWLQSCVEMGLIYRMSGALHLIPVDRAARAIVNIAALSSAPGAAYNFLNPEPIDAHDLPEALHDLGFSLRLVSRQEWCEALGRELAQQPEHRLAPFQSLFRGTPGGARSAPTLDDSHFRAASQNEPPIPSVASLLGFYLKRLGPIRNETAVRT